jgi:TonB family protein
MNRVVNASTILRIAFPLALAGAVVAQVGCQRVSPSRATGGNPDTPDRDSKRLLASASAGLHRNPQQQSIASWPESRATNSVLQHYDHDLVEVIRQSWYRLLDNAPEVTAQGKAVVNFELHSNGSVSGVRTASSTASQPFEAICQKAVLESAPFAPWPEEMRRSLTNDTRNVSFTFYFN